MRKLSIITIMMLVFVALMGLLIQEQGNAQENNPTPTQVIGHPPPEDWVQILQSPSDCPLPCWFGIRPNETAFADVESILAARFSEIDFSYYDTETYTSIGARFSTQRSGDNEIYSVLRVLARKQGNFVSFIRLSLIGINNSDPQIYTALSRFLPTNIINELGVPDVVVTDIRQIPNLIGQRLLMYWPNQGVAAVYISSRDGSSNHLCFNLSHSLSIGLSLTNPYGDLTLAEITREIPRIEIEYRDITAVSTLKPQDIATMLSQNDDCLPTDIDITWDSLTPKTAATPLVTHAITTEDTQTSAGLVLNRNVTNGDEVTHFKITAITNGTLYQNDGVTAINNGQFITVAQGEAGLRFTPSTGFVGEAGFAVQASLSTDDSGLGGEVVGVQIQVIQQQGNAQENSPTPTQVIGHPSPTDWTQIVQPTPDCQLPCWWGITPGETPFSQVETILSTRFADVEFSSLSQPHFTVLIARHFRTLVQGNPTPQPVLGLMAYKGSTDIVSFLSIDLGFYHQADSDVRDIFASFVPTSFASWLGTPDSVVTNIKQPPYSLDATLLMYWNNLGIGTIYSSSQNLCFDRSSLSLATLLLSSPNGEITLGEITRMRTTVLLEAQYRDITTVSSLTPQDIVTMLSQNDDCLPTDIDISWDNP